MKVVNQLWKEVSLLFLFVVFSLANKQVTRILLEGSIFNFLREHIANMMFAQKGQGGMAEFLSYKLYVLFDCPFCMTSQVGIWLVGLPLTLLIWNSISMKGAWAKKATVFFFSIFMIGMASSSLGFFFWNVFDYPQKKLAIEKEKLTEIKIATRSANYQKPDITLLTEKQLTSICSEIEKTCEDKCSCKKDKCIKEARAQLLEKMFREKELREIVEIALEKTIQDNPELLSPDRELILEEALAKVNKVIESMTIEKSF